MPTLSPQQGLSGLESGEALAPERHDAQAVPQSGKLARLASGFAKKVGPILTAAGLAAASAGCDNGNNGLINSAYAQGAPTTPATATPTVTGAPTATPTTTGSATPAPAPTANPFDSSKLVCSNMGLIDNAGTRAAENYRRMFVQTVVSGNPELYEPCATSAVPNEMGRFVQADCSNDGQYRNCVVKDTYVDPSYNVVNTETRVQWLLNGHHNVESPQSVGYIFPMGLAARTGTVISTLDATSPVVYGQRRVLDRKPATATVTPPAPTATAKRFTPPAPTHDNSKDNEQDGRLANLESQVAQNTAKNNEQDGRLNNHGDLLRILIENNSKHSTLPHPTPADYDSLGRSRATK